MSAGLAPSRKLGTILCIRYAHLKISTINSILASFGRFSAPRCDLTSNRTKACDFPDLRHLKLPPTHLEQILHAKYGTSSQSHQLQLEASVQCTHLADASIVCERGTLQSLEVQVRCLEKVLTWVMAVCQGCRSFGMGTPSFGH